MDSPSDRAARRKDKAARFRGRLARRRDKIKSAISEEGITNRVGRKVQPPPHGSLHGIEYNASPNARAKMLRRQKLAAQRLEQAEVTSGDQSIMQRKVARKLELPTHPDDDRLVLAMTQATRKRNSNSAFDDQAISKRAKFTFDGRRTRAARRFPWEMNAGLEQPPNPYDLAHMAMALDRGPVRKIGDLGKLPNEVLDEIFALLLVWPADIRVFQGWSLVFPRERPRLNLSLLYTCRELRAHGQRILFGRNTFVYDIRDPAEDHAATAPVLGGVFGAACAVPIDTYGHLLRHVKIRVPRNRMMERGNIARFADAVRKFLPGYGLAEPANLHTLTLEVPALSYSDLGYGGPDGRPRDLTGVPIFEFFQRGRGAAAELMNLNVQFVRVLATDKHDRVYEYSVDLRFHFRNRELLEEQERNADIDMDNVKQVAKVKEYVEKRVSTARAQLYNIPLRLQQLALYGVSEANKLKHYWTDVTPRDDNDVFARSVPSLQSLPDNWREASLLSSSSMMSQSTTQSTLPGGRHHNLLTEAWLEKDDDGDVSMEVV
ncbi:hypothetical protein F5B20DRAFT_596629 [Whalleya microplaca]|nr:hypothetical protein F5B20DRAFT_596629 [Whalleya microplaca]